MFPVCKTHDEQKMALIFVMRHRWLTVNVISAPIHGRILVVQLLVKRIVPISSGEEIVMGCG